MQRIVRFCVSQKKAGNAKTAKAACFSKIINKAQIEAKRQKELKTAVTSEVDSADYNSFDDSQNFSLREFLGNSLRFTDMDQKRSNFKGSLIWYDYPPLKETRTYNVKNLSLRSLDLLAQADILLTDELQFLGMLIAKKQTESSPSSFCHIDSED